MRSLHAMLIQQTTHVVSTLVAVTTVAFLLVATSPAWSAGAPTDQQFPADSAQSSRERRNSEFGDDLAYGDLGEPVDSAVDKRIGRLASWGKRTDASWLDNAARKAIRSKWRNSNMSVWGKRVPPVDDKRGKWSGNNLAAWG